MLSIELGVLTVLTVSSCALIGRVTVMSSILIHSFFGTRCNVGADNLNCSSVFRELQGIRLQVHQNLLDPFLIGLDQKILLLGRCVFAQREIVELGKHVDVFRLGLVILDGDYLFDASLDAKTLNDLGELPCLQLSESKDVLDVEEQEVGATCLNLVSFKHLGMNILQLLKHLRIDVACKVCHEHLKLLADHKDYFALVDD